MSQLAALLGKLAPRLAASAEGNSLSQSLMDWGSKESSAGPSQLGSLLSSGGGALQSASSIGSRLRGATQSSSGGFFGAGASTARGIGETAGTVGAAFGPMGAVIGKVVEGLFKFNAVLLELPDKIRAWGNQLHEANMQFAEFSGSMAQVQAYSEVQEFNLKRGQGESRAASAAYLAQGKAGLDQRMAPLENLWAKIENYVGGTVLQLLNGLLIPLSALAELLGGGESESGYMPGDELIKELREEEKMARARRPERMR